MASLRSTSDPNSEKRSIANKASSCLQAFADLQKLQTQAEAGGSPCKDSRQDKNDGISLNAVKNELDRFRDWCSHNGATKEGPGSLDDELQLAANNPNPRSRRPEDYAGEAFGGRDMVQDQRFIHMDIHVALSAKEVELRILYTASKCRVAWELLVEACVIAQIISITPLCK